MQTVQMTVEFFLEQLLDRFFDMPVVVQCHMHFFGYQGRRSPSWRRYAVSYGPGYSDNHEIPQLQSIEKVVDVTVEQVQQIPRVLSV